MSVEIKTTKKIRPTIYAYTTPTVTSNEGWIKIGYTERDVTQRIKETNAYCSYRYRCLMDW